MLFENNKEQMEIVFSYICVKNILLGWSSVVFLLEFLISSNFRWVKDLIKRKFCLWYHDYAIFTGVLAL